MREERAEKILLRPRAKDSGWAELLHIIIIITVGVVVIVVNGVGCYCERGRQGCGVSLSVHLQVSIEAIQCQLRIAQLMSGGHEERSSPQPSHSQFGVLR